MEKVNDLMKTISTKTGVQEKYIRWALYGLIIIIFMCGLGGSVVARLVGYFYPAFESFKALESIGTRDDRKWLTYWVVFSLLTVIEDNILDPIVGLVPFYFLIKMGFLIFLYAPLTNGAQIIYDKVVMPVFKQYEDQIDDVIEKVEDNLQYKEKDN